MHLDFVDQECGNNSNSYIHLTRFYLCESKIFAIAFDTWVTASSIYGKLPVMSQSSDFWESKVSATLMQSKYGDIPVIYWCLQACAIACKITVLTSDLYL
jgi:hypothetical protein